jgi:hypothetical protein
MSLSKSGNATHDANVAIAESVYQSACCVAGATQATCTAAAIAFYKSVTASAVNNGPVDIGTYLHALRNLGQAV